MLIESADMNYTLNNIASAVVEIAPRIERSMIYKLERRAALDGRRLAQTNHQSLPSLHIEPRVLLEYVEEVTLAIRASLTEIDLPSSSDFEGFIDSTVHADTMTSALQEHCGCGAFVTDVLSSLVRNYPSFAPSPMPSGNPIPVPTPVPKKSTPPNEKNMLSAASSVRTKLLSPISGCLL